MKEAIKSLKSFDVESLKSVYPDRIPKENRVLVSKLALAAVRKNLTRSQHSASLEETCYYIYNNTRDLFDLMCRDNGEFSSEFKIFTKSYLLSNFDHGFSCSIEDIDQQLISTVEYCGILDLLKDHIEESILNQVLETVDEDREDYEISLVGKAKRMLNVLVGIFGSLEINENRLLMKVYKRISDIRTDDVFDIIISYPDTIPALGDIKESLNALGNHQDVSRKIVSIFKRRLLHIGASTTDIVSQYINAVKALNDVDESGGITRALSAPIQEYLRTRDDLLSTIMTHVLEDTDIAGSSYTTYKINDDDVLREPDQQMELDLKVWNPEPMHSHLNSVQALIQSSGDSDILALLLNVYGSIKSFVEQLEKEIAHRVQNTMNYNFDSEVSAIEVLKLRFGPQFFLNCEVILKDVDNSKRLGSMFEQKNIMPMVISDQYWPPENQESFRLPECISSQIEAFTEEYEKLKHPRKLKWIPSAGVASITLDFSDGSLSIDCSPLHASVINLFNKYDAIDQELIADELEISLSSAQKAIQYWDDIGVLELKDRVYYLKTQKPSLDNECLDEEEQEEEAQEEEDPVEQHIQDATDFFPSIRNILQNYNKISLDRLYPLLKHFVVFPKFDRTYEQFMAMIKYLQSQNQISLDDDSCSLSLNKSE